MRFVERPRVLVVFGSWHGQTHRIAEYIAELVRDRGYIASVAAAGEVLARSLAGFDRFVVCMDVTIERLRCDVEGFVREHLDVLTTHPSVHVCVNGAAMPGGICCLRDWRPDVVLADGTTDWVRLDRELAEYFPDITAHEHAFATQTNT